MTDATQSDSAISDRMKARASWLADLKDLREGGFAVDQDVADRLAAEYGLPSERMCATSDLTIQITLDEIRLEQLLADARSRVDRTTQVVVRGRRPSERDALYALQITRGTSAAGIAGVVGPELLRVVVAAKEHGLAPADAYPLVTAAFAEPDGWTIGSRAAAGCPLATRYVALAAEARAAFAATRERAAALPAPELEAARHKLVAAAADHPADDATIRLLFLVMLDLEVGR